jgi:hypothetical protein
MFPFMIGNSSTSDSSVSYGSPDHHQLIRQQQVSLATYVRKKNYSQVFSYY